MENLNLFNCVIKLLTAVLIEEHKLVNIVCKFSLIMDIFSFKSVKADLILSIALVKEETNGAITTPIVLPIWEKKLTKP